MAEEDRLIACAGDDTEATSLSVSVSASASASSSSPSPSPSISSSPKTFKQKIKLRCSHGGKIMARPSDGHLKYVGGETRVVALPRDITFSELMKKLSSLVDGEEEVVLKYQLVPEELDTLVSVRTDEDLKHMLDEYDRQECQSSVSKMRAYLFPSKQIVMDSSSSNLSSHALEQRYIDAINGIIRVTPPPRLLKTAPSSGRPSFSISSPATSPKVISPDNIQNQWDASHFSSPKSQLSMHRVRSSPSLHYGGDQSQQQGSSRQQGMYQQQVYRHHNQPHLYHGGGGLYPTNSLQPQDFYRGMGRLEHVRGGGLVLGPGAMERFYPGGGRPQMGNRGGLCDEGSGDGYSPIDRSDSLPH